MSEPTGINYIAWWGAALSTLLALVKLWELWNARFRIEVGYNFTSEPDIGNEVFIRNLSSKPIILSYWELLYGSGFLPFRKLEEFESPGPDASDIRIEAHSSEIFTFAEASHFARASAYKFQAKKITRSLNLSFNAASKRFFLMLILDDSFFSRLIPS